MSATPIMEFVVTVDRENISRLETENGKVAILPFTATVESKLFTGKTLPGAADIQVTNATGIRHMCAKYMFEGKDAEGKDCKLFVENNGFFEPGSQPRPFHACPTFLTDSKVLGDYLHSSNFRTEGHGTPEGVLIKVFDVRE